MNTAAAPSSSSLPPKPSRGLLRWTVSAQRALDRWNAEWSARMALARRVLGAPWWAPGLLLDGALRQRYESVLPVQEFCAGLACIARQILPHPAWVPTLLASAGGCPSAGGRGQRPPSLPDLWAHMPPPYAGRVTFTADEMLGLLCALAEPPHFGTAGGRYPEQLDSLADAFRKTAFRRPPVRILDLGCGVGHGTLELAEFTRAAGMHADLTIGLTREPLEAWMARHRCLPHDPPRQEQLRALPGTTPVHFLAGDVCALPLRGTFALVVCNGLVGGPMFDAPREMAALLSQVRRVLAPDGVFCLANRFHEGRRTGIERFRRAAEEAGWAVSGTWRNLLLRRRGP
ncbi:MAG: class I SAM-dependent methyltransferase [Lentisphaeria bacterium]|nr:class I SAM-dependent methyltransferase [Lentisphaeria bacterium]